MAQENIYYATGKRKSAIARTWLQPGKGKILINNRELDDYFPVPSAKNLMLQPLKLTNQLDKFDIRIKVVGGGLQGQAGAIRHGISHALLQFDADLRITLKKAGFIRRDSRVKERKKYGQRGARARYQFSKR